MPTQNVRVGKGSPEGTFVGEVIPFEGVEVDVWESIVDSEDPSDEYGVTLTLYECPDGYRVHEFLWSLSGDWDSASSLYPIGEAVGYGTYTTAEAKEKWGLYFRWWG